MPWLPAQNFDRYTNGEYIPLTPLSHGKDGQIWYTLPKTTILKATPNPNSTPNPSITSLKSQICAIKFHYPNRKTAFSKTILAIDRIHQALHESPNHRHLSARFFEILDIQDDNDANELGDIKWFTMTIVPGVSIFQLIESQRTKTPAPGSIPEELTAHIACQIHEVLRWLHDHRITIEDLFAGNVMLDLDTHQDIPGLPNIVLIDFGNANVNPDADDMEFDRGAFYGRILRELVMLGQPCGGSHDFETTYPDDDSEGGKRADDGARCVCLHDSKWATFMREMGRYKYIKTHFPPGRVLGHAEFSEVFYEMLDMRRKGISAETKWVIRGMMDEAKKQVKVVTVEDIQEVLKRGRQMVGV